MEEGLIGGGGFLGGGGLVAALYALWPRPAPAQASECPAPFEVAEEVCLPHEQPLPAHRRLVVDLAYE